MNEPGRNTFMMTRLPWIVAAVAVVALIATLISVRSRGDSQTDAGPVDQEILARLEALENSRQGTRSASSGVGDMASSHPASGNALDAALTGGKQKTPEQIEADRKSELLALEAAFARDRIDPVRGGQVEQTLEKTVSSDTMVGTGLTPQDVAIDCRATTCKVVGQFAKRGDAEDWALFYVTAAGGNVFTQTRMAYVTRPDGNTEVRIYATRARP